MFDGQPLHLSAESVLLLYANLVLRAASNDYSRTSGQRWALSKLPTLITLFTQGGASALPPLGNDLVLRITVVSSLFTVFYINCVMDGFCGLGTAS